MDNVRFIEARFNSWWASFDFVEAILATLKEAVRTPGPGHILLLSGADYPIRTPAEISAFLASHPDTDFMTCDPAETCWPPHELKNRIESHTWHLSGKKGDMVGVPPLLSRAMWRRRHLFRFLRLLFKGAFSMDFLRRVVTRRQPLEFPLFGGPLWFVITRATADKMIAFLSQTPAFTEFFRYTRSADEIFFQTLIMALQQQDPQIPPAAMLTYVR